MGAEGMKNTNGEYAAFLKHKSVQGRRHGFAPTFLPDCLFDFQKYLAEWSIRQGWAAALADCGLGKTLLSLVWSENVVRHTNSNILIATPLAVGRQFVQEAERFGMIAHRVKGGALHRGINVTNYEQLHHYRPTDFQGFVGDELSCIKNFDGKTRRVVTEFMTKVPYRLGCTATPAPNDHMEIGSLSEALGIMPRGQMLGMFFTNGGEDTQHWALKGHARTRFWEWMSGWARAVRLPSDLGYADGAFILPELVAERVVLPNDFRNGFFPYQANTLAEQREEKKRTAERRCQKVAELLPRDRPVLAWCQLNKEAALLERFIPGAVQVSGADRDEEKEEKLMAFTSGQIRALVTKPKIASFGLNWQHCADVSYFPTHSVEQYYQALRRCWRFGQKNRVNVRLVHTEAEGKVAANMLRKERQICEMYAGICASINQVLRDNSANGVAQQIMEVPAWLNKRDSCQ